MPSRRQLLAGLTFAWALNVGLLVWEFAPGGASPLLAPAQVGALVVVSAALWLIWTRARPLDEGDGDGAAAGRSD